MSFIISSLVSPIPIKRPVVRGIFILPAFLITSNLFLGFLLGANS
jgi:hypothetical protein